MKISIIFGTIFLVFLAPSIHAADFTIDTTAGFDAGTKSQSSGNREIITVSDVVSGAANVPAANELQLENLFSDKFDVANADADTWKLNTGYFYGSAGGSADVDTTTNDKLRVSVSGASELTYYTAYLGEAVTGDFEVITTVNIVTLTGGGGESKLGLLVSKASGFPNISNWVEISRRSGNYLGLIIKLNGISVINTAGSGYSSTYVSFRIRRVGTTIYGDYDLSGGETWVNFGSYNDTNNYLGDVWVGPDSHGRVSADGQGDFDNFKIVSGNFASGGWRTSGDWISAIQTMPAGERMAQTTIYHSGLDATNCIDKVEWLMGGQVKAAYEADITNGVWTAILPGMVTSGSFAAVNADFQVKIYLAGSGSATPVVTKVEGKSAAYGTIITSF